MEERREGGRKKGGRKEGDRGRVKGGRKVGEGWKRVGGGREIVGEGRRRKGNCNHGYPQPSQIQVPFLSAALLPSGTTMPYPSSRLDLKCNATT